MTRPDATKLTILIFNELDKWERPNPWTPEEVLSVFETVEKFEPKEEKVKCEPNL